MHQRRSSIITLAGVSSSASPLSTSPPWKCAIRVATGIWTDVRTVASCSSIAVYRSCWTARGLVWQASTPDQRRALKSSASQAVPLLEVLINPLPRHFRKPPLTSAANDNSYSGHVRILCWSAFEAWRMGGDSGETKRSHHGCFRHLEFHYVTAALADATPETFVVTRGIPDR